VRRGFRSSGAVGSWGRQPGLAVAVMGLDRIVSPAVAKQSTNPRGGCVPRQKRGTLAAGAPRPPARRRYIEQETDATPAAFGAARARHRPAQSRLQRGLALGCGGKESANQVTHTGKRPPNADRREAASAPSRRSESFSAAQRAPPTA